MRCPSCGSSDLGQVRFSVVAQGATFHYCRRCEARWWTGEQGRLELAEVLRAASVLARAS